MKSCVYADIEDVGVVSHFWRGLILAVYECKYPIDRVIQFEKVSECFVNRISLPVGYMHVLKSHDCISHSLAQQYDQDARKLCSVTSSQHFAEGQAVAAL